MSTYELHPGGVTDVGNVRPTNEDHLLIEGDLVAVADGMGGHRRGELASELAVQRLQEVFGADPTAAGLRQAAVEANRAVWERAQADPELRGMGTTIAAAALVTEAGEAQVAIVNVGDSRAYVFREGRLNRLSFDHSVVGDLVRAGELTDEAARTHPNRHRLTHALGVGPDVEPHLALAAPVRGDRLLLCSDGLFNELEEVEITAVLADAAEPGDTAQRLVQLAKDHGGSDNVTAAVIDIT
jgi:protein phosphatase